MKKFIEIVENQLSKINQFSDVIINTSISPADYTYLKTVSFTITPKEHSLLTQPVLSFIFNLAQQMNLSFFVSVDDLTNKPKAVLYYPYDHTSTDKG